MASGIVVGAIGVIAGGVMAGGGSMAVLSGGGVLGLLVGGTSVGVHGNDGNGNGHRDGLRVDVDGRDGPVPAGNSVVAQPGSELPAPPPPPPPTAGGAGSTVVVIVTG